MPSLFFNSSRGSRPAQGRRRHESITDLAWNAAWSSLGLAFLMHIFGTIALGIASGCWDEMVPSLPPGWYRPAAPAGDAWHLGFIREHNFALLWALLFAGKFICGLASRSRHPRFRRLAAWMLRASRRLDNQWFSLTAGNAIAAFVSVMIWQFVQGFSFSGWLGNWLLGLVKPVLHTAVSLAGASDATQAVADLLDWYHANQFKFMFWLFYSAGICDDLGLPNYKALTRWAWWRLRRRLGFGSGTNAPVASKESRPPEGANAGDSP